MRLSGIHKTTRLVVSFELFPPKTSEGETRLFERAIPEMLDLHPAFLTCTYGAGGSTREKTYEIITRIKREFPVEAVTHLTCLGGSREDIRRYLEILRENHVNNVVALRGDPPRGDTAFHAPPDGFQYAHQLVSFIKEMSGMDIAVAGYPEGHPECADKHEDWRHLAEKVAAGADVIFTQLFYDNAFFFEFRDYLRDRLGVKVPIVPGVLPILSSAQIKRFCGLCRAKLPPAVLSRLDAYAEDDQAAREYGIDLATRMCEELIRNGVDGIHFYTLNHAESTGAILRNLKLA